MQMITLTDDLHNHVNALCAKSKAWAESAPEGEYRGYASYDEEDMLSHSKHYTKGERCLTPAEWDQTKAWEEYYDAFKSAEGIRPRWTDWTEETTERWERLADECYAKANAEYEAQQAEKQAEANYVHKAPEAIANGLAF